MGEKEWPVPPAPSVAHAEHPVGHGGLGPPFPMHSGRPTPFFGDGEQGLQEREPCFRKACSPSTHQPWMCHRDVSLRGPSSGGNGSPSLAPHHEHLQNVTASLKPQLPGVGLCPSSTFHQRSPPLLPRGNRWGLGHRFNCSAPVKAPCRALALLLGQTRSPCASGACSPRGRPPVAGPGDGGSPAFQNHRPGHASQTAGLYSPPGRSRKEPLCCQRAPRRQHTPQSDTSPSPWPSCYRAIA